MVNHIVLVGRLTKDPELRYTPNGNPVARFRLAVDRGTKSPEGERQADFIQITCWNKTAEYVSNYMHKGRLVAVEGSLRINTVTSGDGTRREYTEVVCNRIQALERGKEREATREEDSEFAGFGEVVTPTRLSKPADEDLDDDVPF